MQGFDYEKAKSDLGVPDEFSVEAMVAIGRPGRMEDLPENLRQRESLSTVGRFPKRFPRESSLSPKMAPIC